VNKKITRLLGNQWGQRATILVIILAIMAIFQQKFFWLDNVNSILLAVSICGMMACGMLFVVVIGGIDLSVASTAALAGAVLSIFVSQGEYSTESFLVGLFVSIAICIAIGILHGTMVVFFSFPPFIVTLATSYILLGIVQLVTKASFIYHRTIGIFYFIGNAKILGIPLPIILFVITALISAFILGCTTFGRRLYAIGDNRNAAKTVGIRIEINTIIAYIIASISAGLGGIVLVSMNMMSGTSTAGGYVGNVLTAIVVGGVNLTGGEGSVPNAVFGALLVGIINNCLILIGVPSEYQKFVQGVIIISAIALNMYTSRLSQGITGIKRKKNNNDLRTN